MRRLMILAFLVTVTLTPIGTSSPLEGTWGERLKVKSSEVWSKNKTFRAGERACVLAIGDHENDAPILHVAIYDKQGMLVGEDKGNSTLVGDFVTVIWYPPRDGEYRIEVTNAGAAENACYIAIK